MFKPLVVFSALVIGSASFAHADSINGIFSVFGTDAFSSNTISFSNSTVQGTLTGTFATYLHDGDPVTFSLASLPYNLGNNTPPLNIYPTGVVPIFSVFDAATNETFTFDMTSYFAGQTAGTQSCPGVCLALAAYGYVTATGPANLTQSGPATASTTLQYVSAALEGTGTTSTYSGQVIAPTPEPSSLALLGTGMLGAVGLARRKFKV